MKNVADAGAVYALPPPTKVDLQLLAGLAKLEHLVVRRCNPGSRNP